MRNLFIFFISLLTVAHAQLITVTTPAPYSGGYFVVRAMPGSEVHFADQVITIGEQRYVAVGIGRDVSGEHRVRVVMPTSREAVEDIVIQPREYPVQRVNGVNPELVNPPENEAARIQREAQLVEQARNTRVEANNWLFDPFRWPVNGNITGVYGSERFYNGEQRSPHWGIDLASPTGTPVRAPAGGQIVLAESDLFFSGGTIVLNHGGGLTSSFLHLSELMVSEGDWVKQGDVIALVGSTGRSTGPHLDWRMNLHGERIDAAYWVVEE